MTDKNKWEINQGSPVFQFFLEFITYIVAAVLVFLIGFVTSIVFNDFTHLGRAGAVITLLAISMAYKDFYLDLKNMSFDETVKFLGKEKLFEIWAVSFIHKKKNELERIKPGFNEKDAMEFLENLKKQDNDKLSRLGKDGFIEAWLTEILGTWSKKLRGWEFTMLKIGTVLWAFSDLINLPLGW